MLAWMLVQLAAAVLVVVAQEQEPPSLVQGLAQKLALVQEVPEDLVWGLDSNSFLFCQKISFLSLRFSTVYPIFCRGDACVARASHGSPLQLQCRWSGQ